MVGYLEIYVKVHVTYFFMIRKDLINLLLDRPTRLSDLAQILDVSPKDLANDLDHLFKSLKRSDYKIVVKPATCLKCGFIFSKNKLTKPSKCPKCKSTWIDDPLVKIVRK